MATPWKKLATLRSADGSRGHRLFVRTWEGAQVIGIADNSGSTPDQTDDGTLLVKRIVLNGTKIVFELSTRGHTRDDMSEDNVRAVWGVAQEFNIPVEAEDWIGKLVLKKLEEESKRDG